MADTNWCCYCDKAIPTGYSGSLYCSEECLRRDTLEHRRPSADVNALFDPRHYDHKMKQFLFTPQQDDAPTPSSNGDPPCDATTNNSDPEGSTVLARSQSISNTSTTGDSDKVTLVNGDDDDANSS